MSSVRRSLLLSFLDSYLGLILQLASTVIIARLLTPEQVGLFAVAAVFSALAGSFRDFGVAEYLIQERDLSADKIGGALALNIVVSFSMAAAMFGLAPVAAWFYRQSGIADVMRILALNFVLVPFGAVTLAWFRRELRYGPITLCNALSSVAAFTVSVLLALRGHGYMSLAWGSLAGVAATVLTSVMLRPAGFPRWPSFRHVGAPLRFGGYASLIYVAGQLGKGAPELIIGRTQGMAEVGLFSRAGGLVEMFNRLVMRPVLQVCMPYFARADREHRGMNEAYAKSVGYLTAVGWPFLGLMGVCAFALIRLIYGPQWVAAVGVAQVLCAACAVELLFFLAKEALLAAGDAKRANELTFGLVALQVIGLALVIPFGLLGAAWGLLLAALAGALLAARYMRRILGLSVADMLAPCRSSLVLALASTMPVLGIVSLYPLTEENYGRLGLLCGVTGVAAWLLALRALGHGLWGEIKHILAGLKARLPRV